MGNIQRLRDERDSYKFMRSVYGDLNILEELAGRLEDPDAEWSSDDLMYIHFDKTARWHRNFLGNQQKVAAFRRLYPNHAHLINAASDLADGLDRLHTVREELLVPHLRQDGKDVARYERPPQSTLHDRGMLNGGLTPEQQENFESQLDRKGFTKLTSVERSRLRDAILSELA